MSGTMLFMSSSLSPLSFLHLFEISSTVSSITNLRENTRKPPVSFDRVKLTSSRDNFPSAASTRSESVSPFAMGGLQHAVPKRESAHQYFLRNSIETSQFSAKRRSLPWIRMAWSKSRVSSSSGYWSLRRISRSRNEGKMMPSKIALCGTSV